MSHLLMRKPNEIKQEQMKKGSASSQPPDRGLSLTPAGTWVGGRGTQVVPRVSLYETGTILDFSQRDPLEFLPGLWRCCHRRVGPGCLWKKERVLKRKHLAEWL